MTTLPKRDPIHQSLRSASAHARRAPDATAAELARRVKADCPDVSAAQCRRAVDEVVAVRRSAPDRDHRAPTAVPALADRLTAFKGRRLIDAFERTGFRRSRAWEGDCRIAFGAPAAIQTTDEGWINYGRRGYKRGIVGETVRLTVPADWGTRVRPLDDTPGILLLDAERLPTYGDVEVYRAAWCRQGRGVSLVVEHGFLARHTPTGAAYHSTHRDPAKAVAGLKRQVAAQLTPPAVRAARARSAAATRQYRRAAALAALVARVARRDLGDIGHVTVTPADSYRAGNCVSGTVSFVERYLPGRTAATIAEIAAAVGRVDVTALTGADLTLARQLAAACLVAIRRDRSARRALGV